MLVEPIYLQLALLLTFFLSAALHSSIGLGGGSSYTAWMVIFALPALMIPPVALSLNILVSSIVSLQFIRKGLMPWKILGLLLIFSLPSAYIGGSLQINENSVYSILLVSLVVIVLRLFFFDTSDYPEIGTQRHLRFIYIVCLGTLLGLLAGTVGIGGGIYLVPMLLMLGLANIKQAAACGGAFIFCNSLVGLMAKWHSNIIPFDFEQIAPSLLTVAIGGILGSQFSINQKNHIALQKVLLVVLVLACLLLARRIFLSP